MKKFLNNYLSNIFIMLGGSCNLSCQYCMQHDVKNEELLQEVNHDIYEFIKNIADSQENKLNIHFYGGEPLLYYDNIVEFVKELGDSVTYSIISNGKLLNDEIVDFFNNNDFSVAISWDGNNVLKTRGYDVLTEKKDLIFKVKKLGFNTVLSSECYIEDLFKRIDALNIEYHKKTGYFFHSNCDTLLDLGLKCASLKNIDFDRVRKETTNICNEYMQYLSQKRKLSFARIAFVEKFINAIRYSINNIEPFVKCGCGNGYNILNIDLQGNLYKCHNCMETVGNIYSDYYQYISSVFSCDTTKDHNDRCKSCSIQHYCRNGCPLIDKKSREEYYCSFKLALYEPILSMLIKIGGE